MLFNSPLSPSKAHQLIQILGLSPQQRVLDVGCGQGEFLLRLVEATGAWGLGEPSGISRTHGENVWLGQEHGLIPLYAATSNQDEWDHFEWSHIAKLERQAAAHPNDPQWRKKLERGRAWRDGYLRWGRATMGFGFYIFQKIAAAE